MKKRFTQAQIAFALRQAESGTPLEQIIRKMGIAEATFYRWKKKYAGLGIAEIRRLKQLADITCEQASRYYRSMTTCNFDLPVPAELYLHTRSCTFCEEHVRHLRSKLSVAIPQSGSPEFVALLTSKG